MGFLRKGRAGNESGVDAELPRLCGCTSRTSMSIGPGSRPLSARLRARGMNARQQAQPEETIKEFGFHERIGSVFKGSFGRGRLEPA